MKKISPAVLIFALAACATQNEPAPSATASPATFTQPSRETQITQAATAPLNDLNLVRADIPAVLKLAEKGPYLPPHNPSCAGLGTEVTALDAVLGPDLDAPASPSNPGLLERGSGAAGNAAVGALRGAAEGVVPFRSWVRKLSGAERYSREVAAAIAAGSVRRAYLKGLGQVANCPPPAAPIASK